MRNQAILHGKKREQGKHGTHSKEELGSEGCMDKNSW
jgi:hypothetical protein